eukprot:5549700-Prymnesium_polylepis.1
MDYSTLRVPISRTCSRGDLRRASPSHASLATSERAESVESHGMRTASQAGISAVLQERLQKVSVLEVRRGQPADVLERDVSRKELL